MEDLKLAQRLGDHIWLHSSYLHSFLLVGSDASRASAAHNLEINEVNVDGVSL